VRKHASNVAISRSIYLSLAPLSKRFVLERWLLQITLTGTPVLGVEPTGQRPWSYGHREWSEWSKRARHIVSALSHCTWPGVSETLVRVDLSC